MRPWTVVAIGLGGAASVAWTVQADLTLVWRQVEAFNWWLAVPTVALTVCNLSLRFLRWQLLLRRAGVRLPIRLSGRIFVAGLAMLLTPAYAGEGLKTWLVARAVPGSLTRAASTVIWERLFDGIALAAIGGACLLLVGERTLGGALCAAAALGVALTLFLARGSPRILAVLARLRGVPAAGRLLATGARGGAIGLCLSLGAWLCGAASLGLVAAGAGIAVSWPQALGTYAVATLAGGLTLLPAGVGVVGTVILIRLRAGGASLQQAVLAAILVRLLTVWVTAALGIAGSWRLLVAGRPRWAPDSRRHFDALALDYADQLSPAARERVVARKTALMCRELRDAGIGPGARLIDAGCGHGWYLGSLAATGYDVTGVDISIGQAQAARQALTAPLPASPPVALSGSTRLAVASIRALPFDDGAFDAGYAVNVLHHVGDVAAHRAALAELARVVRPGGLIFVHEISVVNPLYRLYMSYLFPLWKRIDVGTEVWLRPDRLPAVDTLELQRVHRYTFLPDFVPRALYRRLDAYERQLEQTRLAAYAAHFTAVYRRPARLP